MTKFKYVKPSIQSGKSFETSALTCAKQSDPPPGSWHTGHAYDTWTGHFGPALGASESASGSAGVGFGPGGTSGSYGYNHLCNHWVTYTS